MFNFDIFLACIGIFFGELYGNFVGGGSLVTQIFLQNIIGFPIKNAIALDNAAVLGSELGLLFMLLKKEKIEKWMWALVLVALFGALLGANLLNIIPSEYVKIFFTLAIGGLVIKNLFFGNGKKSELGFVASQKNIILLCVAGFFIATYNAFLSIGDFIVGLLVLTTIFHFTYHRALFVLSFAFVFARAVGTIEYFRLGLINVDFYIPMFFTALCSGLIAGYFVHKIHSEVLEKFLKYLSVLLALYLIFELF
ncbi:sulfite exporter TauE/SafE family protein [Candidatus Gracilibacteria bacterium]|nr:sulfite exporter TauE/SafE family protein [Candidatus Gracilibacteria bacterium]